MDASQGLPTRGHSRNKSATKATRPRSSTKGPLDVADNPLASPAAENSARLVPPQPSTPRRPSPDPLSPPSRSALHSPTSSTSVSTNKDFSFLLRPEIYHPIHPTAVPPPFRNSPHQPASDTSLPDLLNAGHFRAAAVAAVQVLTDPTSAPNPHDHATIFKLLYTRLACLTLIGATPLAAQEIKALDDLQSPFYVDEATGLHLAPWELRILHVRLHALGFGDPRRAVMSYYELAREARGHIADAAVRHDNSARELWKARLADLGVKVAGALVEMDDLAGAAHHLATLRDDGRLGMARALLWLHLGDVEAARNCVQTAGEVQEKIAGALCDMADGEYGAALATWRDLAEDAEDEMISVNMAVCLLYLGRMTEGRSMLEGLIDMGNSSHTLLFNLTTIYELCTDRSKLLKQQLAQRMSELEPSTQGWEKVNADFKL